MYPRNAASPPRISIGAVVQISDGAVQTSGVAVKVIPQGGSEASGGGTVAYSADGVVVYTPTQAETNYTAMVFVASKTGCIPATVTVVTSASETAGYAGLDWAKVGNPTTVVGLSSTTISTSQVVASVSGAVGSVTGAVTVGTNNDKTGYSLTLTPPTAATIADAVWDEIMSTHTINGSYGSHVVRSANQNQNTVAITGSQHIAADVHAFQTDVIDAAALATSAVTEIQSGLATSAAQTTAQSDLDDIQSRLPAALVAGRMDASVGAMQADTVTATAMAASAVTEIQTGLATLANQTTIIGYLDTEIAAIKTVTDKINTGLVADGAVWQFTVNMLELAPAGGGGGGSGDATEANQLLILNQLDDIQSKTDLISGASGITSLLAGAVLEPGTITSFPEVITIGDSYTEENGRAIQIPIVDTEGNPISSSGALYFADALVTFTISRANETETSRIIYGTATVIDPPGTGTGDEAPYVLLELSSSETAKGLKKYRYTGVLKFTWPGTGTNVVSFETATEITFDN